MCVFVGRSGYWWNYNFSVCFLAFLLACFVHFARPPAFSNRSVCVKIKESCCLCTRTDIRQNKDIGLEESLREGGRKAGQSVTEKKEPIEHSK
jgi:hypothetical protein